MSTVAFITRNASGTNQHGTSAEGSPSVISTTDAKDISLNLDPSDVQSYTRRGRDLHITLADGTIVELDGFYDTAASGPKNLFLSDEGDFIEVVLEDKADGMLFASYEPLDLSGKWSAYDDMVFLDVDRIEPVVAPLVAAPFLGGLGGLGAAAAGAAIIAGGGGDGDGGGGGGDGGPIVPTVNDADGTYDVPEGDPDGVTISGTGEPGSTVEVDIGGVTGTTTVGDDGTWSVDFPTDDLPDDGVYETTVDVVAPDGTTYDDLDGPTIDIDTEPPTVVITEGTQSVNDIVNGDEQESGTIISGTGEPGATVTLEIEGNSHTTTVDGDGNWTLTFTPDEIRTGEYETDIKITTTDPHGNSTVTQDVLEVDTETSVAVNSGLSGGDDIVNAAEAAAAAGVAITGTAEAGATVEVVVEGVTRTTTADSNGTWSVTYETGTLPGGTYDADISVTSTDTAGNSATTQSTIAIDTEAAVTIDSNLAGGDDIVSAAEAGAGVAITGTAEAGSSVEVVVEGVTRTTTADANGNWSVTYESGSLPGGEYDADISVTSTDAVGNTATASSTIKVDTETEVTIDTGLAGGDDIVNATESAAGVAITGTAEAGATVEVLIEGVTRTTTTDNSGNWTVTYEPGTLPDGEYDTSISVTSTDAVGNTDTTTSSIRVDTDAGFVKLSDAPIETDDIINKNERADGVTITGTATAGETVTVTLGTASGTTVADANGNWSYDFAASEIPEGTDNLDVTASISDDAGNTETDTDTVALDTEVVNYTSADQNDTVNVNLEDMQQGFTLQGTVEQGSSVSVEINGTTHDATVDGNGNWSLTVDGDDIGTFPQGGLNATVTATDPAGNVDTLVQPISIDTLYDTPEFAGTTAIAGQIHDIYLDDSGDARSLYSLDSSGNATQVGATETASGITGIDRLDLDTPISDGANLIVQSTDDAGNKSSTLVIDQENPSASLLSGLDGFNIDAIDLVFENGTDGANLVLTEDLIKDLSNNSDTLTIRADELANVNHEVTLNGATEVTSTVDGYSAYVIGDATVLIEEDAGISLNGTLI
ncbi:hypothetical protein KUV57_01130 [Epibacterium sp. DP7N7-1]|nr:hypothetical protein [Epibacterium sp. DP7N7-1]